MNVLTYPTFLPLHFNQQESHQMDLSIRSLITLLHGMGFGGLYLLAGSAALLWISPWPLLTEESASSRLRQRGIGIYLTLMATLAWFAVLSGTFIVYPWYRASPPMNAVDLTAYPRAFLLSSPATTTLHSTVMEWKEHIAWIIPITTTATAAIALRSGSLLATSRLLRTIVLAFLAISLGAAAVSGVAGALINKAAPVTCLSKTKITHGATK